MRSTLMRRGTAAGAVALAATGAIIAASTPAQASGGSKLTGTLKLTAGKITVKGGKASATGTYFRMIEPSGAFLSNPGSTAGRTGLAATFTPLRPGSDGGLKLGAYQPAPNPAFNSQGDALANRIVRPTAFEQPNFSISTQAKDVQTKANDPVPSLTVNGNKVTGNLSAWDAQWNKEPFNQGAPKPSGAQYPSGTRPVTGTYNARTGAITITWRSYIVGGPFNGFTGYWHLQGTLKK